jgi:DNA-binding LytR/AlgR family response regulator
LQDQFDLRPELAIEYDAYTSGEALLAAYKNGARYDALFIDMEMGGMNGIDTANAIREIDEQVIIIFVTSHTRYMKQAFGHNVLYFVEKAHLDTDLAHAIDVVMRELARRRLSLKINDNKKTLHLYYDEIFYIESVAHYLEFHTKDTVYRSRSSLSQFEATLTPGIFARAHKGFLVNLEHVRAVNAADITLRDKNMPHIPLGEKYKAAFRQAWQRYLERKAGL